MTDDVDPAAWNISSCPVCKEPLSDIRKVGMLDTDMLRGFKAFIRDIIGMRDRVRGYATDISVDGTFCISLFDAPHRPGIWIFVHKEQGDER